MRPYRALAALMLIAVAGIVGMSVVPRAALWTWLVAAGCSTAAIAIWLTRHRYDAY